MHVGTLQTNKSATKGIKVFICIEILTYISVALNGMLVSDLSDLIHVREHNGLPDSWVTRNPII